MEENKSKENMSALEPLRQMFEKAVLREKRNLQREFKRLKENVKQLLQIVLERKAFEKRDEFIMLLTETADAIGDCLRLAAKIRQGSIETGDRLQHLLNQLRQGRTAQAPVIVQTAPQPQPQTGGVRGFLAGFWEYKIAKLRAERERETPEIPLSSTETVVDELRSLLEVRPLLNGLIDFASKCFRRYDRHPNPYIKDVLHYKVEQELTKISLILVSASRWALKEEERESRELGVSLAIAAARVAEAQAMQPVYEIQRRELPQGYGPNT